MKKNETTTQEVFVLFGVAHIKADIFWDDLRTPGTGGDRRRLQWCSIYIIVGFSWPEKNIFSIAEESQNRSNLQRDHDPMTCILNFGIAHTSITGLQENPMCFFVFQCNWGTSKNESGNYTHENWTNWYTIIPGKFHKITISFLLKWPLFRGYVDFRRRRPTTTPPKNSHFEPKSHGGLPQMIFPISILGDVFTFQPLIFRGVPQNSHDIHFRSHHICWCSVKCSGGYSKHLIIHGIEDPEIKVGLLWGIKLSMAEFDFVSWEIFVKMGTCL